MAANQRKERNNNKPYNNWTHDDKIKLIRLRIEHNQMFTNKNSIMNQCWKNIAEKFDGKKDARQYMQQWKNLLQKYKKCLAYHTEKGAGDDAPDDKMEKKEWPYFDYIHQFASTKDNYFPVLTIDSSVGTAMTQKAQKAGQESSLEAEPSTSSRFLSQNLLSTSSINPSPQTPTSWGSDIGTASPSPSPSTSSRSRPSTSQPRSSAGTLSAFERYIIKRDKKVERKMNGLLSVFGQLVSKQHPDVPLGNLLVASSSSEDEGDPDDFN